MPAQSTYTPIATITISASGSFDVGFENIPQIYTDLELVVQARLGGSSTSQLLAYYTNGDASSAIRSSTWLRADGSSVTSSRIQGANYNVLSPTGTIPVSTNTAGVFAVAKTYVPNYSNSTTQKTLLTRYSADYSGSGNVTITAGRVGSTAAITSLRLATFSTSPFYEIGSTLTLYGIAAA